MHLKKQAMIAELKSLYLANHRERYPSLPEPARTAPRYTDKTANGLTKCIIDYLRLQGCQAERISSTGRYLDKTKTYTNVMGRTRKIGSGKWIPTSGQKGTADISAVIHGKAVKIEVKMKDKQSEAQKKYQQQVEQAGGTYQIVRSFSEFFEFFTRLNI